MSRKKGLRFHVFAIGTLLLLVLLYRVLSITCPIRALFSVPCPTCGMTRSAIAFLRGDIALSLYYNPVTVPFGLLLLFAIHKDLLMKNKRAGDIIVIVGVCIVFAVYLFRLFYGYIP